MREGVRRPRTSLIVSVKWSASGSARLRLLTIVPSTRPHPIADSSMRRVATACSETLLGVAATSPYPIDVIVITAQYNAAMYTAPAPPHVTTAAAPAGLLVDVHRFALPPSHVSVLSGANDACRPGGTNGTRSCGRDKESPPQTAHAGARAGGRLHILCSCARTPDACKPV